MAREWIEAQRHAASLEGMEPARRGRGRPSAADKEAAAASSSSAHSYATLKAWDALFNTGDLKAVTEAWQHRWDMMHNPLHSAAFSLDPEFLGKENLLTVQVRNETTQVFTKLLGGAQPGDLIQDYMKFKNRQGGWSESIVIQSASTCPAHTFWDMFGHNSPSLKPLAMKILSQVVSSSACERSWSTYDFIHNDRRNRLNPERAEDLVFIFSNLRLLVKLMSEDYQEEFPEWSGDDEDVEAAGLRPEPSTTASNATPSSADGPSTSAGPSASTGNDDVITDDDLLNAYSAEELADLNDRDGAWARHMAASID